MVTTEEDESGDGRVTELVIGTEIDPLRIDAGEVAIVAGRESTGTGETTPAIEVEDAKVLLTPLPAVDEATAVTVAKQTPALKNQHSTTRH
ncbi:hypothetical protein SAMD00023353_0303240 [Rosellinia necatrix]|uniref:Uncharacterized protein n=1 Tax=Rosellinia necatrix TaxID=77044 RepID=A0A1S8A5D1_ROSNE|nr:hypothetical protein SAMD00023353_0303240 [Rosellinia necatrix]